MNKRILKSKMELFGDTGKELSEYLKISRSRLSSKMNKTGGAEFTQGEIMAIKERYKLTVEEVNDIFFSKQVS